MRTWIKFCGTTSIVDALASIEAGADALGFIFAPSKRQVTLQQAQEIIRELPKGIERIGVFLDAGAQNIRSVVDRVNLTGIQMHGERDFPPEVYDCLSAEHRVSLLKIKTLIVQQGFERRLDACMTVEGVIDAILLDSGAGSGQVFDWDSARTQLNGREAKFIIAGGLTPQNVAQAVRTFRPWGVDVVSGVESEPGKKDPEKLKTFVAAVRNAEKETWEAQH